MWAMEPTKRHYSHYHLVISAYYNSGDMAQAILGWWRDHGADIENPGVKVEVVRRDPVDYAMKYITKGHKDLVWAGVMWLCRGRMWGVSSNLAVAGGKTNSYGFNVWIYGGTYSLMWIEAIFHYNIPPEDISQIEFLLRPPDLTTGYGSRAKKFL